MSQLTYLGSMAFIDTLIEELDVGKVDNLMQLGTMSHLKLFVGSHVNKVENEVFVGAQALEEVHSPSIKFAKFDMFGDANSLKVIELGDAVPLDFPMMRDNITLVLPGENVYKVFDEADGKMDHIWNGMKIDYKDPEIGLPTQTVIIIVVSIVVGLGIFITVGIIVFKRKYASQKDKLKSMEDKEALALSIVADFG